MPIFDKPVAEGQKPTLNLKRTREGLIDERRQLETEVDGVNERLGRRVACIVPVADAAVALMDEVVAGKVPGINKPKGAATEIVLGALTPAENAILQRIAWETVSKYPYAGITKFEGPRSSQASENIVLKTAGVVPDALKGWKATQALPTDEVVTDYNNLIEKLPKAERPGVSNVLYYDDRNGRSGVAVLVFVNRVEWTHFLTGVPQARSRSISESSA